MRTSPSNHPAPRHSQAFTRTELLVIIVVVSLLAVLHLTAATTARNQSKVAQCAGNLRQLGLTLLMYGNDNGGKLPTISGGHWPCDVPVPVCDAMMKYGVTRDAFYDPGSPWEKNNDGSWNYGTTYRSTGYTFTFPGASKLDPTYQNSTCSQFQPVGSGYLYMSSSPAARRVLVADWTVSKRADRSGSDGNFVRIPGGAIDNEVPNPHLDGYVPAGGNTVMLDGHVEWHPFSQMYVRGSGSYPCFWW